MMNIVENIIFTYGLPFFILFTFFVIYAREKNKEYITPLDFSCFTLIALLITVLFNFLLTLF